MLKDEAKWEYNHDTGAAASLYAKKSILFFVLKQKLMLIQRVMSKQRQPIIDCPSIVCLSFEKRNVSTHPS
jgi:hypothetical protein